MLESIKRLRNATSYDKGNTEDGFSMAEIVISIAMTLVVVTMGTTLVMMSFGLQRKHMESSISVEFSQKVQQITSIRAFNIKASEVEMKVELKKKLFFGSDLDTTYYYYGSAQDWKLYGANEAYDKCYFASVDDTFGYEVNCDLVPSDIG